jgi:hypothetical protein
MIGGQGGGRWSARRESSASAGGINTPKLHDGADPSLRVLDS